MLRGGGPGSPGERSASGHGVGGRLLWRVLVEDAGHWAEGDSEAERDVGEKGGLRWSPLNEPNGGAGVPALFSAPRPGFGVQGHCANFSGVLPVVAARGPPRRADGGVHSDVPHGAVSSRGPAEARGDRNGE
eukprot:1677208-Pyramimonas_sp.AAC.1